MLESAVSEPITEIKQAAGRAIQEHVMRKIGEVATFPSTHFRGENGYLVVAPGVMVDYGAAGPVGDEDAEEPQAPLIFVRDAVVLLPDGLAIGSPIKTPTENAVGRYFNTVLALSELQPASLETYLEYGERALQSLDSMIKAGDPYKNNGS